MKVQIDLRRFLYFLAISILLVGCSSSEKVIQTAIAKTDAAKPTSTLAQTISPSNSPLPSSTNTPTSTLTPTLTNTPSNTPIPSENQTQTAVAELTTETAEAKIATQAARGIQATSTQKAHELNLTATAASRPSSLTFTELESNYYDLDDEPWNEYRSSLKGEIVLWTGIVLDKTFDTLVLDLGQYAPDRLIALHQIPIATVDKVNIRDSVTFIAKITEVTFYCDVQLNLIEMK